MRYPPGSYLYWKTFYSGQNVGPGTISIGGPGPGQVWIIRELDVYNNAATPSTVNLVSDSAATFAYAAFSGYLDPEGISFVQWTGRYVIPYGDALYAIVGGNGCDVSVSGILLPATLIT